MCVEFLFLRKSFLQTALYMRMQGAAGLPSELRPTRTSDGKCENVPANEVTKNAGGSGPLKSPLPTKLCECAQFEELKRCKEDNQLRLGMCVCAHVSLYHSVCLCTCVSVLVSLCVPLSVSRVRRAILGNARACLKRHTLPFQRRSP